MQPCLKIHGLGVSPHRENDSGPGKQPPSPNLPSAELYSGVRAPSAGSAARRRVSRPKAKQPRNHSAALGESRLIRGADRPWSGSSRPPLSEPTPAAEAATGGTGQRPRRPAFPAPRLGRTLEKEMATHSSILAWKILWTEETGGLQSMGLQSQTRLSVSSCLQSYPALGSFEMSHIFTSGGQSTGVSALASFLPKKSQG